jgi:hypothetical protein
VAAIVKRLAADVSAAAADRRAPARSPAVPPGSHLRLNAVDQQDIAALSGFMARKPNPLHSAIQGVVRDAVANDMRAAERKARQEARRQEREADAALAAADPQAALRERLAQVEDQLEGLKRVHQQKGDALAGRLVQTLELERTQLLSKLKR